MPNRIKDLFLMDARLDPTEAEVWISVFPERLTSGTRAEGRLLGPRCPYANTVEIAYPLRAHSRQYGVEANPEIGLRVLIPEPNLWDPISPFLYEGPVELWDREKRCDQVRVRHGLRAFTLGPRGLHWNQHALTIRGLAPAPGSHVDVRALHDAGYNALLIPVTAEHTRLWEEADRFGLLMVGRIANREGMRQAFALRGHVSSFAWLLDAGFFQDPLVQAGLPFPADPGRQLLGIELQEAPRGPLPQGLQFLACDPKLLAQLGTAPYAKLLLSDAGGLPVANAPERFLGWVEPRH